MSFPVGRDDSYMEQMSYVPLAGQTEVHLAVVLLVERSGHAAEQAVLTLDVVDADIAVTEQGGAPRQRATALAG